MQASVTYLRKRMREIIRALERNENVPRLYRGQKKGVIFPNRESADRRVVEHGFFGAGAGAEGNASVEEEMNRLRGKRH
jgi:hypothetical protein